MSLKNVTIHWKNNFPTCCTVASSTNSMVNIYYGVLTAHINHSFIFIVLPHSFKKRAVKRHFRLIFQTLTWETWPRNATYSWLFSCTATISTLTNGSQCEARIKPTQNCRKTISVYSAWLTAHRWREQHSRNVNVDHHPGGETWFTRWYLIKPCPKFIFDIWKRWPFPTQGLPQQPQRGPNLSLFITSFLRNEQFPVSMDYALHKDISKAKTSVLTHALQRAVLRLWGNV